MSRDKHKIQNEREKEIMKFDHVLSMMKVRQMCIDNDYYTCGDCQEYENMFNMFYGKNVTPTLLKKVAQDIKSHSRTEDEVEDIINNLARLVRVTVTA